MNNRQVSDPSTQESLPQSDNGAVGVAINKQDNVPDLPSSNWQNPSKTEEQTFSQPVDRPNTRNGTFKTDAPAMHNTDVDGAECATVDHFTIHSHGTDSCPNESVTTSPVEQNGTGTEISPTTVILETDGNISVLPGTVTGDGVRVRYFNTQA